MSDRYSSGSRYLLEKAGFGPRFSMALTQAGDHAC
jgi:hypothetical protein